MKNFNLFLVTLMAVYFVFCQRGVSQEITEWQKASYYRASMPYPDTFAGGIWYGDFDNNGYSDMLTKHHQQDGKFTLFLNNGDGSYRFGSTISSIPYPVGGIVADFNNDGKLDFAFAHSSYVNADHRVTVYLGKGDGTFQNYTVYNAQGSYTYFVTAGDLNHDGYKDIIASSAGIPDGFSVFLNNKNGTFTYKNFYNGGEEADDVLLADFNGDNNLDVVMACQYSYGELNVFMGNGDGTFGSTIVYMQDYGAGFNSGPRPIDIVDVDNQNGLDIVVGFTSDNRSKTNRASLYKMTNNGNGGFVDSLVARDYFPLKAYDWNHDGNGDILANKFNFNNSTGSTFLGVALLQNNGKGRFNDAGFLKTGVSGVYEDLNNDGKLDFAFVKGTTDSIGVYLQAETSKAPKILFVKDVPNDQGGRVTVKWKASALDTNAKILPFYSLWRALPEVKPVQGSIVSANEITKDFNGPAYRIAMLNGKDYAWEWLANQPAHRFASYTYTAATLYDSTSTTNGKHYFLVSAHTSDPNIFYDSQPDSGYSVDNLAPLAPRNLAAKHDSGKVILQWDANTEPDLRRYVLYHSASPNIDPDRIQPFATSTEARFIDANPLPGNSFYIVRAQDIHDNLSAKSNEAAFIRTGVAERIEEIPTAYALHQNHPNPFNPSTTIRYAIPASGHVTLKVFDLLGKEIAVLVDEKKAAGEYVIQWMPADLPSGIYMYRLQVKSLLGAGDFVATRKLVLMK